MEQYEDIDLTSRKNSKDSNEKVVDETYYPIVPEGISAFAIPCVFVLVIVSVVIMFLYLM